MTCPQFDLFTPHKCPDAKSKSAAPTNFAVRVSKRILYPPYGGIEGARMDRKLIYSRFRPVRTYRNDTETFTCCAFSPCEQFLMIGNQAGELKLYNVHTAVEEVCLNLAFIRFIPVYKKLKVFNSTALYLNVFFNYSGHIPVSRERPV